jgi:hypothetical protein
MRNNILKYIAGILSFLLSICFVSILSIGLLLLLTVAAPIIIIFAILYIAEVMYEEMIQTIEKNTYTEYEEIE